METATLLLKKSACIEEKSQPDDQESEKMDEENLHDFIENKE